MAKYTSLYLRIVEAKNLPAKDISGTSDPYCVVKVDNEQVARTATVWKTLNPFWGEECTLHLPNGFNSLAVYIYDQDAFSGDDIIGRVSLTRQMLQSSPKGIESWFTPDILDRDAEIQGEIHLEIGRYSHEGRQFVRVKVIEARDLAAKDHSGSSDPYTKVSFLDQHKQTRKVRNNRFPTWGETFEFDLTAAVEAESVISVSVWDWDRMSSSDFMGQVEFKLSELKPNQTVSQWFILVPKQNENNKISNKQGSLRLKARLMEERILPSYYYKPLIDLLMGSVYPNMEIQDFHQTTPLRMLQEVMTLDLLEIANTLVKLYLGQGKIVSYLDVICSEEINSTSDPNTLFRGNSLATKSVDQFMKIVGIPYLQDTLCQIIDLIYEQHKIVELDPVRIEQLPRKSKEENVLEASKDVLLQYVSDIKQKIITSLPKMPNVMRMVFRNIKNRIRDKWPEGENKDHQYVGVNGFFFLRFIAASILSPKLFFLRETHPDDRTSRTLTLVAKTIQNMGNLGLQLGLGKEKWMQPIHPYILESVDDIKALVDKVVDVDENGVTPEKDNRQIYHPCVTLKQGYLWKKRGHKINFVHTFTFKKRYFWLKYDMLSYCKKPTDQVRTNLQMNNVCAVERVDRYAFSRPNIAQIISKNSSGNFDVLYFQAKDINDMYSWISSLRKTLIKNTELLEMFHPGAFRDKWSCCHKQGKDASGCCKTHSKTTLGDWQDPLDPDVEAQVIFSQLNHGTDTLRQKYLETSEAVRTNLEEQSSGDPQEVGSDNEQSDKMTLVFQDACIESVATLLDVIQDLQRAHEAYEKRELEQNHFSCTGGTKW